MTLRPRDVESAIQAAEQAIRVNGRADRFGRTLGDFDLDLPPMASSDEPIDAATMSLMGALYLIAMLEQTGMLHSVELLVEQRVSLNLRSTDAAERLDEAAIEAANWFSRNDRNLLFARLFGLGEAARSSQSSNTTFETRLANLSDAIDSWNARSGLDRPPSTRSSTALTIAVRELRSNLAPRQHGNTTSAGRRLAAQVRTSHEILSHEGIIALVMGRSMWDVVRAMWSDPPEIDRLVDAGQSGQLLIAWAGTPEAARGEPSPSVLDAAPVWLDAMNDFGGAAA